MAISPNDDFTAGQVLTATECNQFPRGVMALATSQTTYTLPLNPSLAIATGMTVTFTAVANRYYKITYYEPQIQTPSVLGNSQAYLKQSTFSGTVLGNGVVVNETATQDQAGVMICKTMTFTAGTVTLVGTGGTSSLTGAPTFIRDATREALLLVEDIGPA
jgi:hypothetical protein